MYELFEKLPYEKKKKILDICIEEFAIKGYAGASTNSIVKKAEISKGALFSYFKNKKSLFLYILDITTDYYVNYLLSKQEEVSTDLFERILDWAKLKMKISLENPTAYNFFNSAFINIPEELREEIKERYELLYKKGIFLTLDNLNTSHFRNDIDKEKAIELILLSLNGLSEKYIKQINSASDSGFSTLIQRFDDLKDYIEILKKVFYK